MYSDAARKRQRLLRFVPDLPGRILRWLEPRLNNATTQTQNK